MTINVIAFWFRFAYKIRVSGLERGMYGFYGWMPFDDYGMPTCPKCGNRWFKHECDVCRNPYWRARETR